MPRIGFPSAIHPPTQEVTAVKPCGFTVSIEGRLPIEIGNESERP